MGIPCSKKIENDKEEEKSVSKVSEKEEMTEKYFKIDKEVKGKKMKD